MVKNKRTVGTAYEDLAAAYLEEHGCRILLRNFRTRAGEIDIIARDGRYLVFAEVKYRRGAGSGDPAAAVDAKKQRTISRMAALYLIRSRLPEDTPCRFDVIAVTPEGIRHIKDAFPYTP